MNGALELECDRAPDTDTEEPILAATKKWLERAVIGLGLCPFAANVLLRDQIRYRVSTQDSTTGLLQDLSCELQFLRDTDPQRCETSLLIHPHVLSNFFDYNEFLNEADEAVFELGLTGELQIASFHPAYQFAGCAPDDIENYSNRSPYPMLHLLREASVARAVATFPGINEIGSNNISTLRRLGKAGWQRLDLNPSPTST